MICITAVLAIPVLIVCLIGAFAPNQHRRGGVHFHGGQHTHHWK